uniref:DNL-type domain-containing protein n=1 Tax=Opuntia streptacantha TaxID=393608 RepID=A0A7C9DAQ4_OPUST
MTTTITSPAILSLFTSTSIRDRACTPKCHLPIPRSAFFRPYSAFNQNPRLRISPRAANFSKHCHFVPFCCGSNPGNNPDTTDECSKESSIDLQLPRRSLLVQFTCDACGERTKRLINRLAYERGTVFVQCAGCLQHHKLVDNLGLVVEYDFRTETIETKE